MVFKVFISHSMDDAWIVYELHDLLKINGIEAYVAEWSLSPGAELSEKIKAAIRYCDCFLVLLTRHGTRSQWVNQEIGIAETYSPAPDGFYLSAGEYNACLYTIIYQIVMVGLTVGGYCLDAHLFNRDYSTGCGWPMWN